LEDEERLDDFEGRQTLVNLKNSSSVDDGRGDDEGQETDREPSGNGRFNQITSKSTLLIKTDFRVTGLVYTNFSFFR
jgi:hypothetical protein